MHVLIWKKMVLEVSFVSVRGNIRPHLLKKSFSRRSFEYSIYLLSLFPNLNSFGIVYKQ